MGSSAIWVGLCVGEEGADIAMSWGWMRSGETT